jgi:hypothetical protein
MTNLDRKYLQRVVGCGDERAGRDARSRRLHRGNRASSEPGSRRGPRQGCTGRPRPVGGCRRGLVKTRSYIISQRSIFTATSFMRICCAGFGVPIWASRAFLIEMTYLPAFDRPSRSENGNPPLNADAATSCVVPLTGGVGGRIQPSSRANSEVISEQFSSSLSLLIIPPSRIAGSR